MNRLLTTLVTIVLLMAAQMASAQTKVDGTLTNDGHTMKWSISGVTVTEKGQPKFEKVNFAGTNDGDLKQELSGTVAPGATITADLQKVSGKDKPKVYILFDYYKEDSFFSVNYGIPATLKEEDYTTKTFTVPRDATEVLVMLIYRTPDPQPRAYALEMNVVGRFKVGNTTPKPDPKPDPKPEPKYEPYDYKDDPDCECMKRLNNQKTDSHIRFNDFYGEVKIRPNCAEDDSYEFVDFNTVIYECDRIKTEEESGAILGLEDMSTYVMGPETKLIIQTEEENISKIEILLGTMWSNVKKMAKGQALEIEMGQCSSGQNGTIFACEETGKESKVWLFAGKVTVTNNKTKKVTVLQPGQNITCKGSSSNVQSFDIEQGAKKFGIPMDNITNHYTNKPISKLNLESICKPNKGTDSKNTTTGKKPTTKKTTTKLSSDQTLEEGVYVIRFAHDPEYVVTLKDGKAKNDNTVQLWKWRNDNSQKWRVTHENGKIAIRSMVDNNYALDVKNFNYSNNTDIILYGYHGGDNQLWIPEKQSNGSYVLMTAGNTAFCLDLYEGDAKNGGVIELWSTHKGFQEQWTFEKVETTGKLKTSNNQKSGNKQVKHGNQNNKGKQKKTLKIKR
jgi:hypothetical protein